MANLQEIAKKFRISDNFLNSKEDGLLIVAIIITRHYRRNELWPS